MRAYVNTTFSVDHGLYGPVKDIYDVDRLKFRIRTLRDVCVKSVNAQTYEKVFHRIFYSDQIPAEIEQELLKLALPRSKLVKLPRGRQPYFDAVKVEDERCIQINLDDDDALAPWYIKFMVNKCKDMEGEVILTFPHGVVVTWDTEDEKDSSKKLIGMEKVTRMHYPMNNHGLSMLTSKGNGTHLLGNHTTIAQRFPEYKTVTLNNRNYIAWVRTESKNSHHKTYHPKTLHSEKNELAKTMEECFNL